MRVVGTLRYGAGSATQPTGRKHGRMQVDFPAGPLAYQSVRTLTKRVSTLRCTKK